MFGAAVAVAATIPMGAGVAVAETPDVVGQTYADASQAIQAAGSKPVIATRIGGRTDEGQCIVTNARFHTTVTQIFEKPKYDEVLLSLNCNAEVASVGTSGPSAASPEGRRALDAQDAG
jgi:hypothetical protein